MDTSEGPAGPRVKAETPDHLASTSVSGNTGLGTGSSGLFAGIASSNKRPRPDDWLAPQSPTSPEGPLPTQHPLYATPQQQQHHHPHQVPQQQQPQQQQQSQQQQQPPLAHSTPLTQSQAQTPTQQPQIPQSSNNNGYASPLSSGSYDPYSPNGKIGEKDHMLVTWPSGGSSLVLVAKDSSTFENLDTDDTAATDKIGETAEMLAVPRVPVAGVKRRWGGGGFQESSPEVSSSGVLSPPPNFHPATPECAVNAEDIQLWNLDLHRGSTQQSRRITNAETTLTTTDPIFSSDSIIEGRDDLSPPSSLNGYSADSCDAKKKKGPTPRQQEELCLVCGDRASGYHYNALTCEGCKGFFRRSITKNAVYQCKYGNNCEIDMYMRRKCQECRLKKCLTVGMRPECVVPEYQCAVKRKEKKAQKVGEKDKPNSTTMNGSPGGLTTLGADRMGVKLEPAETESISMLGSSGSPGIISHNGVKPVSPEQEELIHRLVYFQNEYEQPSDEDLKRIGNEPSEGEDASDLRFRHITEITILTVQLIVEFAKRLPGFDKLLREDQIALLKACSSEVMMLRMARRYDVQSDSIVFANNQPYTRDSYSLAGMGETVDDLLRFCRQIYAMKVDNAEYALLTAIVIFAERPALVEGWKVEKIQEIYLEALKAYVDNRRRPKSGMIFAKLLSVLTELRTLGNQNSEICTSLKLKNKKLPPFLAEIWDVMP